MESNETRASIIKRRGYREDIAGDAFSLYISSYPSAIEHLKERIGNNQKALAELCCGIGVTLEHLGSAFKNIIGVDIDKRILLQCRHNLKIAGLLGKSTLIAGDINDEYVLKKIRADIVIYDIPYWSHHRSENKGDLTKKNPPLGSTIKKIRSLITKDIVIFCSPELSYNEIRKEVGPCELEKVFINKKHDRNHIYLGTLKIKDGVSKAKLSEKRLHAVFD